MNTSRRSRGVLRTAFTAGVIMSMLATSALAIGLASGQVPNSIPGPREFVSVLLHAAGRSFLAGALAGGLFAILAARGARGRQLSTLSAWRVALWGGIATACVPLLAALTVPNLVPLGVLAAGSVAFGFGGGAVSAGMLRVARRAPARLAQDSWSGLPSGAEAHASVRNVTE